MSYLYKNEFEEVYKADIGSISKIIDPKSKYNNKLIYMEESTFNGFCYKDYKKFNNNPDDVCYIAECIFDDTAFVDYINDNKEKLIKEGGISTANSIKQEIKDALEYDEYFYEYQKDGIICTIEAKDFDEEMIDRISKEVFETVDWQTTQAYICETDWREDIKNYYNEKFTDKGVELC